MPEDASQSVFDLIGEDGIRRMVHAFYERIPQDDILGPMYPPDDFAGAEERLMLFLLYRLGGPPTYLEKRGHPALRMRHAPFAVNQAARDRWMRHMQAAIDETISEEVRQPLSEFLANTATFLINRSNE